MTVKNLQERARELGINNYSAMNKAQLEEAISKAESNGTEPKTPARENPDNLTGASAKLAWVQQQVEKHVAKTGYNDHHKYDYFQEHGVFAVVKPLLRACNAGVLTDVLPDTYTVQGNHVRAFIAISLFDPDLPRDDIDYAVTARYPAGAVDSQDKGDYKLLTQGEKYAWQKFFKVPTEAAPDVDTSGPEDTPNSTAPSAPTQIAAKKAAALRATAKTAIDDGNLDQKAVTAYLTATFKKNRVTELTAEEGALFEAWLNEKVA